MKKHFFWRFSLILSLLFAGYWAVTYANLKNPMSEMMYSETSDFNLMGYQSLGEVIGDEKILENNTFSLKSSDDFKTSRYIERGLEKGEELTVTVFRDTSLLFMYDIDLQEKQHIGMIFSYESSNNSFTQDSLYLHKDGKDYKNEELLTLLATYGKDKAWLRQQSEKVVEDYILGTWFEHGSDRYSLDNLGNLTIEYHELVTEE